MLAQTKSLLTTPQGIDPSMPSKEARALSSHLELNHTNPVINGLRQSRIAFKVQRTKTNSWLIVPNNENVAPVRTSLSILQNVFASHLHCYLLSLSNLHFFFSPRRCMLLSRKIFPMRLCNYRSRTGMVLGADWSKPSWQSSHNQWSHLDNQLKMYRNWPNRRGE